jgi:hypothetical protein
MTFITASASHHLTAAPAQATTQNRSPSPDDTAVSQDVLTQTSYSLLLPVEIWRVIQFPVEPGE